MDILKFPLGELQANCYLLIKEKDCLIIDPGDSAEFILEEIQRRNLHVVGILATHGHYDHVMAVGELQLSVNAPFYIHEDDVFLLKRLQSTVRHFVGNRQVLLPQQVLSLKGLRKVKLEPFHFEVLHIPGHTPGSCAFYFKDDAVVFTGDTLFRDAVGGYDHSYSNKIELFESVDHLLHLPEETTVYPGHGEEALVQELQFMSLQP